MKLLAVGLLALILGGASAAGSSVTESLYVVSLAGGPRHQLTTGVGIEPSVSPNGREVAYVGPERLAVMSPDGSNQRDLGIASGEGPSWSPDGKRLVYTAGNGSACIPPAQKCVVAEVWGVDADGTNNRKLLGRAWLPAWSPSGRRVLFRYFTGPAEQGMPAGPLQLAAPDGRHVRTLFKGIADDGLHSPPAWSPNGAWIAFDRPNKADLHQVYLIRPDGSHRHRLTLGGYPSWSPNGKLIAFERNGGVWVVPAAGGRARRIAVDGACPTWSPGGRWIAFLTNGNGYLDARLDVVRPNGRGRRALAVAADCYAYSWAVPSPPAWSRDGSRIFFTG